MQASFLRAWAEYTGILLWLIHPEGAPAQSCRNPVACENMAAGDTGWDIRGSGDTSIQGFATSISINAGEKVFFKVRTDATSYRLDIFRMGYYGGSGARKVATINPSAPLPHSQPPCVTDSHTKLVDCGNWAVSASWIFPRQRSQVSISRASCGRIRTVRVISSSSFAMMREIGHSAENRR